jgi:hypothetical protein
MGYKIISSSIIKRIRAAKIEGHSVREIAKRYSVSVATVSLYCRDLFSDSQRKYPTRKVALKASHYKDGSVCVDCSGVVSMGHTRCKDCRVEQRKKINSNPKCIYCGGRTIREGMRITKDGEYQRHQCVKCGKHMKGVGAKKRFNVDIIDRLISVLPIEIREDIKQDVILECLELGINMNREDKVSVVVKQCLLSYKRQGNRQRFQEVSIYKKISNEDDRTMADMIADPNSDFTKDMELDV